MRIKNLWCFIFVAVLGLGGAYALAEDLGNSVIVTDAWVQAMPPSQNNTAAYMTIANNSFKDIVLTGVSSDVAGIGEIHKMGDMNGMMNMAPVTQLKIPALGRIIMTSTSVHFMLINLKKPLQKGDIVPITLHFQGGGTVMVNAKVKLQYGD